MVDMLQFWPHCWDWLDLGTLELQAWLFWQLEEVEEVILFLVLSWVELGWVGEGVVI